MEALPSLKVEKQAGGEKVVQDIQRVSITFTFRRDNGDADTYVARIKTNWTMLSRKWFRAVFSPYLRIQKRKPPR
jgi:hypothetical protein